MTRDRYESLEYDGRLYNEISCLESEKENLQRQLKEIKRLTAESTEWESKCYKYQYIINELEKYLEKIIADGGTTGSMTYWYKQVYNYLQELKEDK